MGDADDEERALRIDEMTVNIEKMRSDMKWEARKFLVSAILATAAAVGAGIVIGSYVTKQPASQQFVLPPGTTIQIVPVK
jgi:hypothetical protein